jgi:hypothetical protein
MYYLYTGIGLVCCYIAAGTGCILGIISAFKHWEIENPFNSKSSILMAVLTWPWVLKAILDWSNKKDD